MIFDYNVIHEGKIYKAGEDVPTKGTSLEALETKEETKTAKK